MSTAEVISNPVEEQQIRETEMKRIALTSCLIGLLQALTGCCSCCQMSQVSPCYSDCYSSCVPENAGYAVNEGCCGEDASFALPPSPYATYGQRGTVRMRSRSRGAVSGYGVYSADPYLQNGVPQVDDGSMYESFGSEVSSDPALQGEVMQGDVYSGGVYQGETIQGNGMPAPVPGDTGWQPVPAGSMPSPAPVPDSGPTTFSTPTPIPKISTAPGTIPGPPSISFPRTTNSVSGPNMSPMPPAIPDNVSQMGYRRQLPIQRAF